MSTRRRFYRMGDVVRQDEPGGVYWFVGRVDNQVKIRGVRVELEAVERVFRALDGVAEAVVVAVPLSKDPSVMSLVAFAVLDRNSNARPVSPCITPSLPTAQATEAAEAAEATEAAETAKAAERAVSAGATRCGPTAQTLTKAMAKVLPSAAVPSVIQILDSIPQTPNGKCDRAALHKLVAFRGNRAAADVSEGNGLTRLNSISNQALGPSSSARTLRESVCEVLAIVFGERLACLCVSTCDGGKGGGADGSSVAELDMSFDFYYDLGGDSLALVQVVGALAERTGVRVRLQDCPPPGSLHLGWFEQRITAARAVPGSDIVAAWQLVDATIQICELSSELVADVASLFCESFVAGEPLMVALQVPAATFRPFAHGFCTALATGVAGDGAGKVLSFVGMCGSRVVAYSLNERFDPDEGEPALPPAMLPAFAFLAELDEAYFAEIGGAPVSAMHMIAAGATAPAGPAKAAAAQRRHVEFDSAALVLRLEQTALARAADLGIERAFTTCTNRVTAVVAEEGLGFRQVVSRSAQAFKFGGKEVFAAVPDVHEMCAVYEKLLKQKSFVED
jgi:hypothetical protein